MGTSVVAQGFSLFFLCGPLSHIHLRINISQRVKVITSTNTWYHRSAKEHIPLKFQLYSSFKNQRRNDCTKSGSRVLTFPYNMSDPDDSFKVFLREVNPLLVDCFKRKKSPKRNIQRCVWYNPKLLLLSRKKDRLFKIYLKKKTSSAKEKYYKFLFPRDN